MEKIGPRYEQVLRVLIEEHIKTGRPVGSRTISKRLGGVISPATVRNIMQDLEDMGFVRQPHTSAGRVPTAAALRYYIANMMKPKKLSKKERETIERVFLGDFTDILQLLEDLGKILAALSNELSLIVAPVGEELVLHRIELIPVSSERVVMVLVTRSGLTRSMVMEIPDMVPRRIEMLGELLNQRLAGLKFSEIKQTITERLADLEKLYGSFTTKLIRSAEEIFRIEEDFTGIFGRENILEKPEFSSPERLRQIMEISERGRLLLECLPQPMGSDVEVLIAPPPASQLGFVVAGYRIGSGYGLLGVVGPTRMNYPKLVELVSYAAQRVAEIWSP